MTSAAAAATGLPPSPMQRLAESALAQRVGVVIALALVASWHWDNDGLWFQGDAPRHALTGALFGDAFRIWPADPLGFALGYFARYPALVLGAYPPLFHLVEGLLFAFTGPSTFVAKGLVLSSAGLFGFYTHLWGRRWIGAAAGWAGVCVLLAPWLVQYSNSVLLNVPAAALGLGALYHAQAWLDQSAPRDRWAFVLLTLATIATYVPGALVLPIAVAWMLAGGAAQRLKAIWLPGAAVAAVVGLTALALPEHFARQGPSFERLWDPANWTFYGAAAPRGVGWGWLALMGPGIILGFLTSTRRTATARLLVAFAVSALCLAVLPAQDTRYATLLVPFVVLIGFMAVVCGVGRLPGGRRVVMPITIALMLGLSIGSGASTPLPRVAGFDTVASFLKEQAPRDGVLYSGVFDGVFTYYVRALDPKFERRVMRSGRLLSEVRQQADFTWRETLLVSTPEDVVARIHQASGCQWVAIELGGDWVTDGDRLLSTALAGPAFQFVRSIPVEAGSVYRVDVYRVTDPVAPAPPQNLSFPSFSSRVFSGVVPVATRP